MRTIVVMFGGMALVAAMVASADDQGRESHHALNGKYAVSGTGGCISSPNGFTGLVPNSPASSNSFTFHGIWGFNKDGTGTAASRVVSLADPDVPNSGANASDNSSTFTYSLADDGTLTVNQGTLYGASVAPVPGQQSLVTDIPALVGNVSTDKKTLLFASYLPDIERLWSVVPGLPDPVLRLYRICQRSLTAVRVESDQ